MYIDDEATNPQFYKIKEHKKVEQKITFGSNRPCLSFNSFFNFSINSSIESYVNKILTKIGRKHHTNTQKAKQTPLATNFIRKSAFHHILLHVVIARRKIKYYISC